jgi:hypothetical protein
MLKLTTVEMSNTEISNLDVLDSMKNLKILKIFRTKISEKKVAKFKEIHPGCEVTYY